ncbi:TRMT1-like protein [Ischnura elegans]|uniref:TRMT1-like protein n=1 Tax=Ischnura elegans TaxID=197161 RepID=UPI001ED89291|nr:TRMT1-like protein [Ischnura elegans]
MQQPKELVHEYGVKLQVDSSALSPKKSGAFYNRDLSMNRGIVIAALAAYLESGNSVLNPIRVLDGVGATGIFGILVRNEFKESEVEVTVNDPSDEACSFIKDNATLNGLSFEVLNRDTCALMHERPFNFIYLDCHTSAAQYFDAAFRNIPKRGIFVITTSDDPALYGRTPEIALRNYGGKIVKTAYFKELAIRLVLAGLARSAARFNKAISVLCSVSVKASFTLIIEVTKGAAKANDCLQQVQSMLHCSICEDWAFVPNTQYPLETPTNLLRCDCRNKCPGKTASCIGPLWSGPIFNSEFLSAMLKRLNPSVEKNDTISPLSCHSVSSLLGLLLEEALCRKSKGFKREAEENENKDVKRLRGNDWESKESEDESNLDEKLNQYSDGDVIRTGSRPEEAPPFYLSLHHRLSGRGNGKVPRADSAVIRLREAGFRASRTHFDPCALRTNALPSDMWKLLGIQ